MRPDELAEKLTGGTDGAPVWLSDVGGAEIIDAATASIYHFSPCWSAC